MFGCIEDEFDMCESMGTSTTQIEKPTIATILSYIDSGIAFDIAPNHTGVVWKDSTGVHHTGFSLPDIQKDDPYGLARQRLMFKNKVSELFKGHHFDHCLVENVYGGENFDTTRQLLNLNPTVAELVLEGVFSVGTFYSKLISEWLSAFNSISPTEKGLKSKVRIQELCKYFEFDFYIENCNLTKEEKEKIFFEDICDAMGMLCCVSSQFFKETNLNKERLIQMKEVRIDYLPTLTKVEEFKQKFKPDADCLYLNLLSVNQRVLNDTIRTYCTKEGKIFYAKVYTCDLGKFGLQHNLPFYDQGYGYLTFTRKNS